MGAFAGVPTIFDVAGKGLGYYLDRRARKKAQQQQEQTNQRAESTLGEIPNIAREGYNPFIEAGAAAEQEVFPHYTAMANTPEEYLSAAMAGYQESPYFNYMKNLLNRSAHNTAASGGYVGTEGDILNRSELMNQLAHSGLQDYLQNVFNVQSRGMSGLERRSERGFEAGTGLANYLGGAKQQQAFTGLYGDLSRNAFANEGAAGKNAALMQLYDMIKPNAQKMSTMYSPLSSLNQAGNNWQNPTPQNYITSVSGNR